jgi:hypothetical protein
MLGKAVPATTPMTRAVDAFVPVALLDVAAELPPPPSTPWGGQAETATLIYDAGGRAIGFQHKPRRVQKRKSAVPVSDLARPRHGDLVYHGNPISRVAMSARRLPMAALLRSRKDTVRPTSAHSRMIFVTFTGTICMLDITARVVVTSD